MSKRLILLQSLGRTLLQSLHAARLCVPPGGCTTGGTQRRRSSYSCSRWVVILRRRTPATEPHAARLCVPLIISMCRAAARPSGRHVKTPHTLAVAGSSFCDAHPTAAVAPDSARRAAGAGCTTGWGAGGDRNAELSNANGSFAGRRRATGDAPCSGPRRSLDLSMPLQPEYRLESETLSRVSDSTHGSLQTQSHEVTRLR
jgi:hypothetical protein